MKLTAQTANEAFKLYEAAYNADTLIQGAWHSEHDGRQLACALGMLGENVNGPRDCPAAIMPRWLAQMVPNFFDRQKFEDAKDWGLRFYAALDKVGGNVPFRAIHRWHAETVCQIGIEAAEKRDRDVEPHKALQNLHRRALEGQKISADEWRPVLRNANAYANAYADADANAYANANAYAYADAYAYAYANAYANAYAYAYVNADAYADAKANAYADVWKRLADGMVSAIEAEAANQVLGRAAFDRGYAR